MPNRCGFKDIYEYAARVGGASRAKVDEIIRIGRSLEKTIRLQTLFLRGEIGWSKLRVILNVVTPETDEHWAKQVQNLSKRALEALVQGRRQMESTTRKVVDSDKFGGQPTLLSWDPWCENS